MTEEEHANGAYLLTAAWHFCVQTGYELTTPVEIKQDPTDVKRGNEEESYKYKSNLDQFP
tara:strand:+ start:278 stop:457 length:180 start_codon:yes stop_codon:yes gene_type:complete